MICLNTTNYEKSNGKCKLRVFPLTRKLRDMTAAIPNTQSSGYCIQRSTEFIKWTWKQWFNICTNITNWADRLLPVTSLAPLHYIVFYISDLLTFTHTFKSLFEQRIQSTLSLSFRMLQESGTCIPCSRTYSRYSFRSCYFLYLVIPGYVQQFVGRGCRIKLWIIYKCWKYKMGAYFILMTQHEQRFKISATYKNMFQPDIINEESEFNIENILSQNSTESSFFSNSHINMVQRLIPT